MSDDIFDLLNEVSETPFVQAGEKVLLEDKVREARVAYYNGNPIMSDAEYDVIEERLRALDPHNPLLTTEIGAATPQQGTWPKTAHQIPMGSLNKIMPDDKVSSGSKIGPGLRDWWAKTEVALRS